MPLTVTCQNAFNVGLKLGAPFSANIITGKILQIPGSSDDLLKWSGISALAANVFIAAVSCLMKPCRPIPHVWHKAFLAFLKADANAVIFGIINSKSTGTWPQTITMWGAGFGVSIALEFVRLFLENYVRCCPEREFNQLGQSLIDASSRPLVASSQVGERDAGSVFQVVPSREGSIQNDGSNFRSLHLELGGEADLFQPGEASESRSLDDPSLSENGVFQEGVAGEQ